MLGFTLRPRANFGLPEDLRLKQIQIHLRILESAQNPRDQGKRNVLGLKRRSLPTSGDPLSKLITARLHRKPSVRGKERDANLCGKIECSAAMGNAALILILVLRRKIENKRRFRRRKVITIMIEPFRTDFHERCQPRLRQNQEISSRRS